MAVSGTASHRAAIFPLRPTWRGLLDRIAAADKRYRERMVLSRLDDRILRDVGATRADVAAELRRRF